MWNKESIQNLINSNDKAVYRALQAIYARQTRDEQSSNTTKHSNGVGFTAFDAEILSDIARKSQPYRGLTRGQTNLVRKKIRKYWRQLAEIANDSDVEPRQDPVVVQNERSSKTSETDSVSGSW